MNVNANACAPAAQPHQRHPPDPNRHSAPRPAVKAFHNQLLLISPPKPMHRQLLVYCFCEPPTAIAPPREPLRAGGRGRASGSGVVGERRNGNILVFGGRKKEVDNTSVLVASCHPLKRRCHFWKLCHRSCRIGIGIRSGNSSGSGCIEWPETETALVRGRTRQRRRRRRQLRESESPAACSQSSGNGNLLQIPKAQTRL